MNLAKTIILDVSDENVFPQSSSFGEWAIAGTFLFTEFDPNISNVKERIAFREGWLGTETFGFASLVQVTSLTSEQKNIIVSQLSIVIFNKFNAPDMSSAVEAATCEINDMIALCEHPVGTILKIKREINDNKINEQISTIQAPNNISSPLTWTIE